MQRKISARTLALAVLPLAALLLVGIAAAQWTDSLQANLQVTMGNLDVDFANPTVASKSPEITVTPQVQALPGDNNEASSEDLLSIAIGNAYPGANAQIDFQVVNSGSISADVSFTVNSYSDQNGCVVNVQLVDDNGNDLNGKTVTLAPGQSITVHMHVSVPQDMTGCEGQQIQFTAVQISAVQHYTG